MDLTSSIYAIGLIFFISVVSLFNIKRISSYIGLYDYSNPRKIHKFKTSLFGGVILYTSFLVSFYFYWKTNKQVNLDFVIFTTFFFVIGFFDDLKNINSRVRILSVIFFLLIFFYINNKILIEKIFIFNSIYYFNEFSKPITVICVLLLYISYNMLDGIDGLMLLIFIFSLISLFLFYKISFEDYLLFISLIFSSIILLIMNIKKQLFIGNSGTSTIVAILSYFLINYNYSQAQNVFYTISILIVPGIDMIRLFFIRIKSHNNPLVPDQNHFHHILFFNYGLFFALCIYLFLIFSPILLTYFFNLNIEIMMIIAIFLYLLLIKFSTNVKCKS